MAQALEIKDAVTSPTFTLIQEYYGKLNMYHMDLYRLESLDEFEMIGAEEYFYNNGVTLIEWWEKAEEILPDNTIYVNITIIDGTTRKIEINE